MRFATATATAAATACMLLAASLVGCSPQEEPARRMAQSVTAAVAAVAPDAARFDPNSLERLQTGLAALERALADREYAQVVASAPSQLIEARDLSASVAEKKAAASAALDAQWSALAASVTAAIDADRDPALARGRDPQAAAESMRARAKWSQAQAAFAAGNLEEAVATAGELKAVLDNRATDPRVELPKTVRPASRR